jgi:hypothetical protein
MKAKVRSVDYLIKNRSMGCGLESIEILDHAGKIVTLTDVEDMEFIKIKEDGGYHDWEAWMFENDLKDVVKQELIEFPERIDTNTHGYATSLGFKIGCETIPFDLVEKIYKACAKLRPPPVTKKKKGKKK